MINIHEERLKAKLALWDTPGFFHVMTELQDRMPEVDIHSQVGALRKLYQAELEKIQPKSKFKQGKLL